MAQCHPLMPNHSAALGESQPILKKNPSTFPLSRPHSTHGGLAPPFRRVKVPDQAKPSVIGSNNPTTPISGTVTDIGWPLALMPGRHFRSAQDLNKDTQ